MESDHRFNHRHIPRKLLEDRNFQDLLGWLKISLFISDSMFDRIVSFTSNLPMMLGTESMTLKKNPSLWGELLRSKEGSRIDELMVQALDKQEDIDFEIDILDSQGKSRRMRIHLLLHGTTHHHEIFGQIKDITLLREKEIALARMESYEVEISARIQKKLLLGKPRGVPSGLKIEANSIPSQKVDGDFYDFNSLMPHIQDFFIGDVMGKGLNAALLGAGTKNLFNKALLSLLTSGEPCPELNTIVDLTDSYLSRELIDLNSFITLNYSRIDTHTGIYSFVDCGHNPIIHYSSAEKSCWIIKGDNKPLGFDYHQKFQKRLYPVNPGDLLFLYSDGITEVQNREGEPFSLERLIHLIRGYGELAPKDLIQKVLEISFNYSFKGFNDDVTGLALKLSCDLLLESRDYFKAPMKYKEQLEIPQEIETRLANLKEENLPESFLSDIKIWISSLGRINSGEIRTEQKERDLEELSGNEEEMPPKIQEREMEMFIRDRSLFLIITYAGDLPENVDRSHPFDLFYTAQGIGRRKKLIAVMEGDSIK